MIVKNHEADRFVAAPPKTLAAALVYGPDAGLVQERAEKLARQVVPDLTDPFNVADFNETALLADPARLADEAAAISMMGGRRVVRVRGATNASAEIFETLLSNIKGDALVVAEAGDLAKTAALRKLFESQNHAAAIACYPDSARDLADVVRDGLRAEGLSITPDALEDAVSRLGSDRGVTRRELEKLALYARGQDKVTIDDVRAVMGDEAEARSEAASDAAGTGDFARLDRELERLWTADVAPAQIIRSAMGHFQKLLMVRELTQRGEPLDVALKKLRPPLHFSRAASFKAQAQRWTGDRLGEALDLLLDAEVQTRTTGVPAEAVTARTLMNIAAMAKGRA
ncbi:MAG: DNA polymerase III subunit delta [Alphaproteobacteria bacterium 64-11]|nr:DNA polymerase III subunit delta [Alphaproteobacteria bacterium]OJU13327.1 MAG: DNA polymerase III subunit delta [Alphaproteobacteria bacterium 64-11]